MQEQEYEYELHWKGGGKEFIWGVYLSEACIVAGISGEALRLLHKYEPTKRKRTRKSR